MYFKRRLLPRTEGPQPVYKSAVDAAVRTWMPAAALLLACTVTPAREPLDVRSYEWGQSVTWVPPVVDATVRAQQPAATAQLASFSTSPRQPLDIRRYEWSQSVTWIQPVVDATVRAWQPASTAQLASFRTPDRLRLDIRSCDWEAPESSWLVSALAPAATVAQQWPAVLLGSGLNYQTPERLPLDVRGYEWTPTAGVGQAVDRLVATWMPAATSELSSLRTWARPGLDVRGYEWAPTIWTAVAVDATVQTWLPAVGTELASSRTSARPVLDVRSYEWPPDSAWIAATQTSSVSVAQQWPAVLSASLFARVPARSTLDVRNYDWTPTAGIASAVDAAVLTWTPAATSELASTRTDPRAGVDTRGSWAPSESGWIAATQAATVSTAQQWPAVLLGSGLNYRTPSARPALDCRLNDGNGSGFLVPLDQSAAWQSTFDAQRSATTAARPGLDVREYGWAPTTTLQPPIITVNTISRLGLLGVG